MKIRKNNQYGSRIKHNNIKRILKTKTMANQHPRFQEIGIRFND
jgi:hypothetical protein